MVSVIKILKKNIGDVKKLTEYDFIKKHCNITIVNFCDDFSYFLFNGKREKVLLKLNKRQIRELKRKLFKKNKDVKNDEIYKKFKLTLNKINKINYSMKILLEKKIKIRIFADSKEEINKIEERMLILLDEKKTLQIKLLEYMDLVKEEDITSLIKY